MKGGVKVAILLAVLLVVVLAVMTFLSGKLAALTMALGLPVSLLVLGAAALAVLRRFDSRRPGGAAPTPRHAAAVLWRYGLAALAVGLAVLLRWWLERTFGDLHAAFITFYPAVLLVALVAGGGPGVLATVFSVLAVDYFFCAPTGSLGISSTSDMIALDIFGAVGLMFSLLAERLKQAHWSEAFARAKEQEARELARQNEQLTQQSEELAQQSEELARQNEELQAQGEEIHALNSELAERENTLQKLLDAARLSGTEDSVLTEICAAGLALFGPAAAAVVVYEKQGPHLLLRGQAGLGAAPPLSKPVEHSFADLVLHAGRTAAVEDLAQRPDLSVLQVPGQAPFRAALAGPMPLETGVVGVVAIYAAKPQPWTAEHFRLVEWLATQCAHILQTLRLQERNRASEQKFATAFADNAAAIALTRLDDGLFLEVNNTWLQMTGFTREEAIGHSARTMRIWPTPEDARRFVDALKARGAIRGWEQTFLSKSGAPYVAQISSTVLTVQGQQVILSTMLDITERQRAEQALRESEAKYRNLFRNMTEEVHFWKLVYDAEGHIKTWRLVDANPPALRTWGRTLDDIRGKTTDEIFGPGATEHSRAIIRKVFSEGRPHSYEDYFVHLDRYFRFTTIPLGDYFITTGADITAIKRAQKMVEQQNAILEERVSQRTMQLRTLAAELTRAEERERRKLARILHDSLQQLLVAARMRLDILSEQLPDAHHQTMVAQVAELLNQSIDQSRSLTAELSPPILYDAGLRAGLEWLGRWMEDKHHLQVHVGVDEDHVAHLPEDLRVFLFQAVREMLFNAAKHAGVDQACVGVRVLDGNRIEVVVEDRGRGFDPALLHQARRGGGFGLFSIRERLQLLGGHIEVQSAQGQGTRLTLILPLPHVAAPPPPAPLSGEPSSLLNSKLETRNSKPPLPPAPPAQAPAPPGPAPASASRVIRVLLADDHKILREGLLSLLSGRDGIEVVGQAANGREAVELARQLRPDVVIMDVSMPVLTGIEATAILTREFPSIQVIGLSMHGEEDMAAALRAAGAVTYLRKDSASTTLLGAIESCRPRQT